MEVQKDHSCRAFTNSNTDPTKLYKSHFFDICHIVVYFKNVKMYHNFFKFEVLHLGRIKI